MTIEITFIALALAAAGLIKGLTGLGLPLIAIPVMALFMEVEQAILVMALPSALVNGWQAVQLRRYRTFSYGPTQLVIGSLVGAGLGASLFSALPPRLLAIAMAVWILLFLAIRLAHPALRLSEPKARQLAPWAGLGSGVAQTTTGIPGPVVATYFHALDQDSRQFTFSVSAAFALLGVLQLVLVNWLGLYQWSHFASGLVACVPALAVMHLTGRFAHRVPPATTNRLVYGVLLALAGKLLFF